MRMKEVVIPALIGAGISIITTALTLLINALIEKNKLQAERQQKREDAKRERLTDIYTEFVSIMNSFPMESPNDILETIEEPPHYSLESFDSVIDALGYQVEEYKRILQNKNIDLKDKDYFRSQIVKMEYIQDKLKEIREEYFKARDNYRTFCKDKKMILDLYAGQDVRDNMVDFDILIHGVFISGYGVGSVYDLRENKVEIIRQRVIDSMRKDIGLD